MATTTSPSSKRVLHRQRRSFCAFSKASIQYRVGFLTHRIAKVGDRMQALTGVLNNVLQSHFTVRWAANDTPSIGWTHDLDSGIRLFARDDFERRSSAFERWRQSGSDSRASRGFSHCCSATFCRLCRVLAVSFGIREQRGSRRLNTTTKRASHQLTSSSHSPPTCAGRVP